ncbi:hypothetical protein F5Y10DRAFT_267131 [Nemania abortiva]|nr:hypothetical protein F5Y10DRAFT_267131 [Nemania abortiva]
MASLALNGANLLRSGDWSDFTLVCRGQVFRVHKCIVCPQSPVLAASLFDSKVKINEFLELWTLKIEVEFDPVTLQCMLDFCYKGTYPETPFKPVNPPDARQTFQAAFTPAWDQEAHPISMILGDGEKRVISTVSDALIYHARVNGIAAHYGVVELARLSAKRAKALFTKHWSVEAFCTFIKEINGSVMHHNLHWIIVGIASDRIFELMKTGIFCGGKMDQELIDDIRRASLEVFDTSKSRLLDLELEITIKKAELDELNASLRDLFEIFSQRRMCCHGADDKISMPESIVQAIKPPVQEPEPAVKKPEPAVKKSEPVAKEPKCTVEDLGREVEYIEPAAKEPKRIVKDPEPTVKQPELPVRQPKAAVQQPKSAVQSPSKGKEKCRCVRCDACGHLGSCGSKKVGFDIPRPSSD